MWKGEKLAGERRCGRRKEALPVAKLIEGMYLFKIIVGGHNGWLKGEGRDPFGVLLRGKKKGVHRRLLSVKGAPGGRGE